VRFLFRYARAQDCADQLERSGDIAAGLGATEQVEGGDPDGGAKELCWRDVQKVDREGIPQETQNHPTGERRR
jgi:hypothetical protein